jgi:hypothetical protein
MICLNIFYIKKDLKIHFEIFEDLKQKLTSHI